MEEYARRIWKNSRTEEMQSCSSYALSCFGPAITKQGFGFLNFCYF